MPARPLPADRGDDRCVEAIVPQATLVLSIAERIDRPVGRSDPVAKSVHGREVGGSRIGSGCLSPGSWPKDLASPYESTEPLDMRIQYPLPSGVRTADVTVPAAPGVP